MNNRVCITGVGVVSSIGIGKEEFLSSLKAGKSGIDEIKEFDTRFSRSKKGGRIRNFNPRDFIAPSKIRRLDRASQFAIAASKLALADARFSVTSENASRVGVVLGSGFCGLSSSEEFHRAQVLKGFLDLNPMLFPNTVPNAPASYVSIELGIQGVNATLVQSFCTAEAAILFACDQIHAKRADLILAGGVDELSEFLFRGCSDLHLLATDKGYGERSSPYDRMRNGIILGEGAGILTVESEEHAHRRGARILGTISGYSLVGSSHQGEVKDLCRSIQLALPKGQEIRIDYISGAGNSSKEVDSLEAKAIDYLFPNKSHSIPVSSVKGMLGEAMAMGGIRMVANLLAMEYSFIPPTINYQFPDPECDLYYITLQSKDHEIHSLLHLGISPKECYSAFIISREWNP